MFLRSFSYEKKTKFSSKLFETLYLPYVYLIFSVIIWYKQNHLLQRPSFPHRYKTHSLFPFSDICLIELQPRRRILGYGRAQLSFLPFDRLPPPFNTSKSCPQNEWPKRRPIARRTKRFSSRRRFPLRLRRKYISYYNVKRNIIVLFAIIESSFGMIYRAYI